MGNFVCDQTIARDRLQRRLDWMNPKTGIRRRLLDLFYDTGTRWTWHTVLGLALVGVPYTVLLGICIVGSVCAILFAIPITLSLDLVEGVLGWFSRRAFRKYRRLQRDLDGITSSGNTEP